MVVGRQLRALTGTQLRNVVGVVGQFAAGLLAVQLVGVLAVQLVRLPLRRLGGLVDIGVALLGRVRRGPDAARFPGRPGRVLPPPPPEEEEGGDGDQRQPAHHADHDARNSTTREGGAGVVFSSGAVGVASIVGGPGAAGSRGWCYLCNLIALVSTVVPFQRVAEQSKLTLPLESVVNTTLFAWYPSIGWA